MGDPVTEPTANTTDSGEPPIDVIRYPLGTRIEMGERATEHGGEVYFALFSSDDCPASLHFWVDAISKQPLISVWSRSGGQRVYPLDKILAAISNAGHPLMQSR